MDVFLDKRRCEFLIKEASAIGGLSEEVPDFGLRKIEGSSTRDRADRMATWWIVVRRLAMNHHKILWWHDAKHRRIVKFGVGERPSFIRIVGDPEMTEDADESDQTLGSMVESDLVSTGFERGSWQQVFYGLGQQLGHGRIKGHGDESL